MPDALPATAAPSQPAVRRATRGKEGRWLGGVCVGLAEHLRVPVTSVRVAFLVFVCADFIGALAYGLLWLLLPEPKATQSAPGLESTARAGFRQQSRRRPRSVDIGVGAAVVALGVGLVWLTQALGWGVSTAMTWPVVFACIGLALVWRQADNSGEAQAASPGPQAWWAPLLARDGIAAVIRVVVGLGFVGGAVGMVIASQIGWALLPQAVGMFALALGGVALVVAPWAYRARQQLVAAREEKILADQRADMAAHLHDSVLQTLALIQRQSDDPKAVAVLARRQERELRTWLYGETRAESTFKAALTRAASEVEDERGVPVEIVVVGDAELTDDTHAIVQAAREAIMNAAKHSGADLIDVYAEASDVLEVFVRDRGSGFDPDTIDSDRQGVRRSILGRMERHGGTATIRSAPGEGTEVRLEMKR